MTEVLRRKARRMTPDSQRVIDAIARAMEPRRTNIAAGDFVSWNGYRDWVLTIDQDRAVIVEPNNQAFGRAVKWTLQVDALTRVGPCK